MLIVQYLVLVALIVCNSLNTIVFTITEQILKLYMISVFVETLSAMGVMIAFAFASGEESKIVEILNNIIKNYQKVDLSLDKNQDDKNK